MPERSPLKILHATIERRCEDIAASFDWPCRAGCSRCCRRLSGVPAVTAPEWDLIWASYLNLPLKTRDDVLDRVRLLAAPAPYTCPFLDLQTDQCRIYEARPVACRTYGFYVERNRGLYCWEMLAREQQGEWDQVCWGNAVAVTAELEKLGTAKDLKTWFAFQDA